MRFLLVNDDDLNTTASGTYHEHSKTGEFQISFGEVDPKRSPGVKRLLNAVEGHARSYPYRAGYELADPDWAALGTSLGFLLEHRRSRRRMAARRLPLPVLGQLLTTAAGKNGELRRADGGVVPLRSHPSG